jgi:flagellar basal-body rod protein FlgC
MDLQDVTDIAVSGLRAQRIRLATAASNLANAETTRTAEGGPYRRRDPIFASTPLGGDFADALRRELRRVEVPRVVTDRRPPQLSFDPGHPDADPQGFVALPRVNVVEEYTNVLSASRSYEASVAVLRKAREMGDATLQIGR